MSEIIEFLYKLICLSVGTRHGVFLVDSVNIPNIMNTPRRVPTAIRPNIYMNIQLICANKISDESIIKNIISVHHIKSALICVKKTILDAEGR